MEDYLIREIDRIGDSLGCYRLYFSKSGRGHLRFSEEEIEVVLTLHCGKDVPVPELLDGSITLKP